MAGPGPFHPLPGVNRPSLRLDGDETRTRAPRSPHDVIATNHGLALPSAVPPPKRCTTPNHRSFLPGPEIHWSSPKLPSRRPICKTVVFPEVLLREVPLSPGGGWWQAFSLAESSKAGSGAGRRWRSSSPGQRRTHQSPGGWRSGPVSPWEAEAPSAVKTRTRALEHWTQGTELQLRNICLAGPCRRG